MSLESDLKEFEVKTNSKNDRTIKMMLIEIGARIVERSPVGDADYWLGKQISSGVFGGSDVYKGVNAPVGYAGGRFRANWQHGVGSMPLTTFEDVDATGQASTTRLGASIGSNDAANVHYIVNNLPYSIVLENGHSWHQAPNGMVGITVTEFDSILRSSAAKASYANKVKL